MQAETFVKVLGADFYTGVPDSQLKALCNYLMNTYGIDPKHHVIGANEETVPHWQQVIIWQPEKYRWSICRIQGKEISSIRRHLCSMTKYMPFR